MEWLKYARDICWTNAATAPATASAVDAIATTEQPQSSFKHLARFVFCHHFLHNESWLILGFSINLFSKTYALDTFLLVMLISIFFAMEFGRGYLFACLLHCFLCVFVYQCDLCSDRSVYVKDPYKMWPIFKMATVKSAGRWFFAPMCSHDSTKVMHIELVFFISTRSLDFLV